LQLRALLLSVRVEYGQPDRLEYFLPRLPDWMRVAVEFLPGGALAETAFPQHGQHPTNVTHIT